MPFTLGLTPEDRAAATNAATRLRNIGKTNLQNKSYLFSRFVLEESKNITSRPDLLQEARGSLMHLANVIEGAIFPEWTLSWTGLERDAHVARINLTIAYIDNVKSWIQSARRTMQVWCGYGETPELPKDGWRERDTIERALEQLGKATSLLCVPEDWVGFPMLPRDFRQRLSYGDVIINSDGDPAPSSSDEASDGETDDGSVGSPQSEVWSDSDEDDGGDEEWPEPPSSIEDTDDDGDDEGDEIRRTQGGTPPVLFADMVHGWSTTQPPADDSDGDDDDEWEMPNTDQAAGTFINGQYQS